MPIANHLNLFVTAIRFYTRIPVSGSFPHSQELLNQSRAYLPSVGIIVGVISAIVYLISRQALPISLSVILAMLATAITTGAFHEDGLADTCDGFGGGWNKEQTLMIMKDSQIGVFGAIGLFFVLTIKFLALIEITRNNYIHVACVLVFAHTLSRFYASSIIDFYSYVQNEDVSKVKQLVDKTLQTNLKYIGLTSAFVVTLLFLVLGQQTLVSIIFVILFSAVACWCFAAYCRHKIGGYTGDTLGASQQISEITIYILLLV